MWMALISRLWGTESNAFLTSRITEAIWVCLVSMVCQVLVTDKRASWVDDRGLNPN